ncbi:CBS domain-containing protein [Halomonas sp. M4R1S46]|uniref:CBS domain-containing protein n=1 Tax=Halomonas sp. M4R1S46 TaxID=2982692 RepID=UPI0021E4B4E0|nr:CBS domain-containing protein [Halomonas sp. M4R1S46]UYG06656.1 CBS domain-containing protein [Halomonas sp. M4R1S46]
MTTLMSSPDQLETLGGQPFIVSPARTGLSPDNPAMTVLTDFTRTPPLTIPADTLMADARKGMQYGGVRLLLVVDDLKRCLGVLTAREAIGGRRTTLAMQNRNIPRDEVTVAMVQTPCQELKSMPLEQLANLTIGELVHDLSAFGDQHLLVTERDRRQGLRIRGVISAADIGRALGTDMSTVPEARSFADICRVVLGHEL